MRIVTTRGTVIAESVESARGLIRRLIGLIGRRQLACGSGLLIHGCSRIHTLFMRFPIDVVYLDRALRVLRVDSEVVPWRVLPRCVGAFYVIELPGGEARVAKGEALRLEDAAA